MNVKLYLALIFLACLFLGIYLGSYLQKIIPSINISFEEKCYSDTDCSWVITNCCPETSGAKWECVNLKIYKQKECPSMVVCPQIISLKPEKECICKEGSCTSE